MKTMVLVTTEFRGVFFGLLDSIDEGGRTVTLRSARNVMRWAGSRGFLGLASHGPEEGSRIGPACPRLTLYGVTSIADVTPEAEEQFKTF